MPWTLDETYQRILSAIDDQYFEEARTALEWLVFSGKPLIVRELAEACSIDVARETGPSILNDGKDAILGILGIISSLVLVERTTTRYQL